MSQTSSSSMSIVGKPPSKITDPRPTHAQAIKNPKTDFSIFNNLITLYSQSHHRPYALRLFRYLPSPPTVVSWTALISAHSNSTLALQHFVSMLRRPVLPNQRTLASLFKTCAFLSSLSFGLQLHSLSLKLSLSTQPFSASGLVHFYSRTKLPCHARKAFDEIPHKDEVCYSSIVVGLAQNAKSFDALSYFADMWVAGFSSNKYSVSGALCAVAELAALEQCRMIHGHCVVSGLDLNLIVGTALIDGYGKCGLVREARCVFDELMPSLNVIGWNAMLSGYAQQGDTDSAVELFGLMEDHGFVPDWYSFLAVMTAFCHAGLVTETEWWLKRMETAYGLEPWLEHYTCMVGVMGRVGKFEDAKRVALTMRHKPDAALWRALLSTCGDHEAVDVAKEMSGKLLELDPQDDSAYVIAANVFSRAGRWDEVQEMRKLMKDRRVRKEGGLSWIEVAGRVHVFLAWDRRHERTEEIYAKLAELMAKIFKLGYFPIWEEILHEVGKGEQREALLYHSEKLALAFGLVSGAAPPGKSLRIVKNLRICRDCHEVFKYISRIVDREIVMRDVNRYHRFLCGSCSCGDCW